MSNDPLSPQRLEDLLADVIIARDVSGDGLETVIELLNYYRRNEADHKAALDVVLHHPKKEERREDEQHPEDRQDDAEHQ